MVKVERKTETYLTVQKNTIEVNENVEEDVNGNIRRSRRKLCSWRGTENDSPSPIKKKRRTQEIRHQENEPDVIKIYDTEDEDVDKKEVNYIGENVPSHVFGLVNLGNSCFLNATVQCLLSLKAFMDHLLFLDKNLCENTKFFGGLHEIVMSNKNHSLQTINPVKLYVNVQDYLENNFDLSIKQDAQEFMHILLTALHEESIDHSSSTNSFEQDSLMSRLFRGELMSCITCLTCNSEFEKPETFWDISVPVPEEFVTVSSKNAEKYSCSLEQCLTNFTASELLEDLYICSYCNSFQTAKKNLRISKFPKILVVNFKRFKNNGSQKRKIRTNISYPMELKSELFENAGIISNKFSDDMTYDLIAICCHEGSLNAGHYISYTKSLVNQQWYEQNDEFINKSTGEGHEDSAYILFYEKRQ